MATQLITPEVVQTAYMQMKEKIQKLKLEHAETLARLEELQTKREDWMLAHSTDLDFAVACFVDLRDEKSRLTAVQDKQIAPRMEVFEKFMAQVLTQMKSQSTRTQHGTPYFQRQESVSVADWDAFTEAEIFGPINEVVREALGAYLMDDEIDQVLESVRQAPRLNFLNKAANKTAILEEMGDIIKTKTPDGQTNESRPNPPPPGINYNAVRRVFVKKGKE